jgi:hypothetical protein
MGRFPLTPNRGSFWQFSAALGVISLAGCAGANRTPPAVEVRVQRVEIPVAVACIDKTAIPAEPVMIAGRLTGNASQDLDLVSASALRLRVWGRELRAMLGGCVK